jgi:hypothetical protein
MRDKPSPAHMRLSTIERHDLFQAVQDRIVVVQEWPDGTDRTVVLNRLRNLLERLTG